MAGLYNDMPPLMNSSPFQQNAQFPGGGYPNYQGANDPYYSGGGGYPESAGYSGQAGYRVPLGPDGRPDWSQQPVNAYGGGGGYEQYPQMSSSPFMPQTPLGLQRTSSRRSNYEEDPNRAWPPPSPGAFRTRRSSFNGGAARPHHKVPTDWREDFQMPGSQGLSRLLSMSKRFFIGGTSLHPILEYKSTNVVTWDMRLDPMYIRTAPSLQPRPFAQMELHESATDPPVQSMRITHESLPWYVSIQAPANTVITIQHLVQQLFFHLRRQISEEDYYNDSVEQTDRERIYNAFVARCRMDQREYGYGVRRVDYLGDDFWFWGLKKRGEDLWELRTGDVERKF